VIRRLLGSFLLASLAGSAGVAETPSALAEVWRAEPSERSGIVERLAAAGTPLIDGPLAIFLAQGHNAAPPLLHGDFNWFGRYPEAPGAFGGRMEPIPGTDWWYAAIELVADARVEYSFAWPPHPGAMERDEAPGERILVWESVPDPLNPHRTTTFGLERSVIEMPGYEPSPWVRPADEPLAGRLERLELGPLRTDSGSESPRRIEIYLPPGYPRDAPYPTVYFNDGGAYLDEAGAHRLLDAMIRGGALTPVIGVFVDPLDRREEYRGGLGFPGFMAELAEEVDRRYETVSAPSRRAIVGGSRGALGALYATWGTERLFGRCGLLAPAISPDPILEAITSEERRPIRFSIVGARYDVRFLGDYFNTVDRLLSAGYPVSHRVVSIGHSPTSWRHHLPQVLIDLLTR